MANCVYMMTRMLHFFIRSPYIDVAGKHGKRHAMRAHKPQTYSNWLDPHSLGTMSAFGYFENFV